MAMVFRQCLILGLLLTAQADRPRFNTLSDFAEINLHDQEEQFAQSGNSTEAMLAELESNGTLWGCTNYCFECPGGEMSWKIVRARSTVKKFAMGAFAVGTLIALSATGGILALPLAGAFASVGIASGTVMAAGAFSGTYLIRDLLTNDRTCTQVSFKQKIHDNAGTGIGAKMKAFFGAASDFQKEQTYDLQEVNLLELMGQMEAAPGQPVLGGDYARAKIAPQDRLKMILACNFLQFETKKWADMAIQSDHMTQMVRKYGDTVKAVIGECGKWLCANGEPVEVHALKTPLDKCGGRRVGFGFR